MSPLPKMQFEQGLNKYKPSEVTPILQKRLVCRAGKHVQI